MARGSARRPSSAIVTVLFATFGIRQIINSRPVRCLGPVLIEATHKECDWTSDQDIWNDGASDSHNEQLNDVERPQNEDLVRCVEQHSYEEDPADVLQHRAKKAFSLVWLREKCPQERPPPLTGIPKAGSNCQDGDHGWHHQQSKVQRPARPSEELFS
jgi:hypothetical protein